MTSSKITDEPGQEAAAATPAGKTAVFYANEAYAELAEVAQQRDVATEERDRFAAEVARLTDDLAKATHDRDRFEKRVAELIELRGELVAARETFIERRDELLRERIELIEQRDRLLQQIAEKSGSAGPAAADDHGSGDR